SPASEEVSGNKPNQGNYVAVAAGILTSCALTRTGSIDCWGMLSMTNMKPNQGGYSPITKPLTREGGLTSEGTIECFGEFPSPTFRNQGNYVAIAQGFSGHVCAVTKAGTLDCAGDDHYGQTSGCTAEAAAYGDVTTNGNDVCAVTREGRVSCWGTISAAA